MSGQCSYKECSKSAEKTVRVSLVDSEDTVIDMPFCFYHSLIVIGGDFLVDVSWDGDKPDCNLLGPFERVSLIEQVFAAIETTRKHFGGTKK